MYNNQNPIVVSNQCKILIQSIDEWIAKHPQTGEGSQRFDPAIHGQKLNVLNAAKEFLSGSSNLANLRTTIQNNPAYDKGFISSKTKRIIEEVLRLYKHNSSYFDTNNQYASNAQPPQSTSFNSAGSSRQPPRHYQQTPVIPRGPGRPQPSPIPIDFNQQMDSIDGRLSPSEKKYLEEYAILYLSEPI